MAISNQNHKRRRTLLVILLIALAIPLTVTLSQKQQEIRQQASTCIERPSCLDQNPPCKIAEPVEGWCPQSIKPSIEECPQDTTPAKNPTSGQCINYPNPCAVPNGWEKVVSCSG